MLRHTEFNSLVKVFYNMRCLVMFATAVCILFLLKLKWPKNKSYSDLILCLFGFVKATI